MYERKMPAMRRRMRKSPYLWDIGRMVVVLLFIVHAFSLYECAMRGHRENGGESDQMESSLAGDSIVPVGPMYSLRVHYLLEWPTGGKIPDTETLVRSVAPADVLVLSFRDNMKLSESEIVTQFKQTQCWMGIVPLNPSPASTFDRFYQLPERRLSFLASNKDPTLAIMHIQNITAFLRAERISPEFRPASGNGPLAVCFLLEKDPSQIQMPFSSETLQDALEQPSSVSVIPSMAKNWSQSHNASWVFFLSPCRKSQLYSWDGRHSQLLGNTTLWWVCTASEMLIEVNVAARLITVTSEE